MHLGRQHQVPLGTDLNLKDTEYKLVLVPEDLIPRACSKTIKLPRLKPSTVQLNHLKLKDTEYKLVLLPEDLIPGA